MKKMFIGNLPHNATEENVSTLFAEYGTVCSLNLVTDVFSGNCKGFGFVEMEGREARAVFAGPDGMSFEDKFLKVKYEIPKAKGRR